MHQKMSTALQDLQLWDRLSLHECEEIAHFIADFLPDAFRFVCVETYQAGTQSHQIALFEWKESPRFRRTLSLSPLIE